MIDTIIQNETDNNTYQSTIKAKNTHLFNDDSFQRLIDTLDKIYNETQVRPSFKKLVNLIIEKANLEAICKQLIEQYS